MNNDFIYGLNPVFEAIQKGDKIDKLLIRKGKKNSVIEDILDLAKQHRIPFFFVPEERLNRVTRKNHQGCIALSSPIDFYQIEDVLPEIFEQGELPLIVILDGITDVRNFGAITRSCLAAGVHTIIISSKNVARISPDAVKTSAGALLKIKICREDNLSAVIEYLQQSGLQICAATEKADHAYFNIDFKSPTAIVMGSEDTGISASIIKRADHLIKIPMQQNFDSLNVSVSAGILVFEASKQRLLSK